MASIASNKRSLFLSTVAATILAVYATTVGSPTCTEDDPSSCDSSSPSSLGRYPTWEAAPASREEFDHDNDKDVCRLQILSVEEWEAGRYWEKDEPVIVKNVTDGWQALEHWTK